MEYNASEQDVVINIFAQLLRDATKDGGKKRAAGTKPPWYEDEHLPSFFSHLAAGLKGEKHDKDSGAHPFTHAAWRLLAIADQETRGRVAPQELRDQPEALRGGAPRESLVSVGWDRVGASAGSVDNRLLPDDVVHATHYCSQACLGHAEPVEGD